MGNNPKFRVLAGLMLAIFVFVSAAWTPQPAVAQEAAPVTVEIVVPAMTAETNNQPVPPPPSGWPECDPERGGTQLACQGKADGRLAQFGYAGAPWSNPGAAYAHLVGAVKPNGEEVFSHCTASMAAFWTGSDCYPVEKELSLSANATCEGWSVEASVSVEGAAISFSPASAGVWAGAYTDGQSVTVSATATWASGESVTDTITIQRPDCRIRDLTLVGNATCEGWSVEASVSVEGAAISFSPASEGIWQGEFVDGQVMTVSATATWASGESVTRTVVIERPDCRPRELSLSANATCEGWSVEASVSVEGAAISFSPASAGVWAGAYTDGQSVTVSATATWASGESVTDTITIQRPDCRIRDLTLVGNATCEGWSVEASVSVEGAAISFSPASEGIWQGEFVDGQVMTVSATATWASGESVTRTVVIERPDCRPAAPQCTKDGFATVYVTVTYTDGKGRVQPLEGQRIGLDVDRDGSIEYADVSNHNGELMFHVALVHWSRHSDLVYLGDARETDPQTWGDVAVTWGDDQSGKPLDEQRHGWLWGLTDCISAFGAVQVGLPTPINPPVAALPAAPCEEQGG